MIKLENVKIIKVRNVIKEDNTEKTYATLVVGNGETAEFYSTDLTESQTKLLNKNQDLLIGGDIIRVQGTKSYKNYKKADGSIGKNYYFTIKNFSIVERINNNIEENNSQSDYNF